jgi:transposase-like protein
MVEISKGRPTKHRQPRPRVRSLKPGTHQYGTKSRYTEETLKKVLEEIRTGKKFIKAASREYGIPRSTLKNKLKEIHSTQLADPWFSRSKKKRPSKTT